MKIETGDIYISGGRTGWGERLIHFGTTRGALGLYVGIPLLAVLLTAGLFASSTLLFAATAGSLLWVFISMAMLEGRTWADHAEIAVGSGELGEVPFAVSSQSRGATVVYHNGNAPQWCIYRIPWLTDGDKGRIAEEAYRLIDLHRKYRMKLNVAFGCDYVLSLGGLYPCFVFRRWLVAAEANVCSVFVIRVLRDARVYIPASRNTDPRKWSPDDLDDMGKKRLILVAAGCEG